MEAIPESLSTRARGRRKKSSRQLGACLRFLGVEMDQPKEQPGFKHHAMVESGRTRSAVYDPFAISVAAVRRGASAGKKCMSGTHNIRKRAELDAVQALDAELERLSEAQSTESILLGDEGIAESPASSVKFRPDPVISASLLSSCRRCNWVPDRGMTILFGGTEPRSAEEFRSLRSRLYSVRKERALKSLLVVSALPGEGRTFVAANLARVLALQSGCRVLLIDGDMRKPRLHSAFGTVARPGLSEYLLRESEEFGVMQRGRSEDLYLIPAGRSVQGQGELAANGRLESLIRRVVPVFDWIIVDSPPALKVTDACLLSNYCDGVLFVVRSHSTPFDVVKKARMKFREDSLVGVVLNKIEANATVRSE